MPFFYRLVTPKYAAQSVIESFKNYRDAVCWSWENRPCHGMDRLMDQSVCAKHIGVTPQVLSRCVNRDSKAPMELSPDCLPDFEAYTGWKAPKQFLDRIHGDVSMEQVMAERKAA